MQYQAPTYIRTIRDDKLVHVLQDKDTGRVHRQPKPAPTDCLLSVAEIREYQRSGPIRAVKLIMANHKLDIAGAYNLLKRARGPNTARMPWEEA